MLCYQVIMKKVTAKIVKGIRNHCDANHLTSPQLSGKLGNIMKHLERPIK